MLRRREILQEYQCASVRFLTSKDRPFWAIWGSTELPDLSQFRTKLLRTQFVGRDRGLAARPLDQLTSHLVSQGQGPVSQNMLSNTFLLIAVIGYWNHCI